MSADATRPARYDAVVVGAGHNGLTAAAYLARAGRTVLVLERLNQVGGAAVSAQVFRGVDAQLSRYSYLVSLMPRQIVEELGLDLRLVRRRYSSYTPVRRGGTDTGLLIDADDSDSTRASFTAVTGGTCDHDAWRAFYGRLAAAATRIWPTMTDPLVSREELRRRVDDDATWEALVERPIGEVVDDTFGDDDVTGIVLTDALIGTFASVYDPSLLQNRCFLYHVIGNGTGDWDVPVGGMGRVSSALEDAARTAGARILTGARVTGIDPAGAVTWTNSGGDHTVGAGRVLAGCAPSTLATLLGDPATGARPEGAQLKVNMLLSRLPRLRDDVDPAAAFAGTFHVNESASQLETAHAEADDGRIPSLPPCEMYCHSLSDQSILGPRLRADGVHTMTLFGLHMPARLFRGDNETARARALAATLRSVDDVLAEPIEDCLLRAPDGGVCLEARTPVDLEQSVGLPGGHIFHGDLSWPFAEHDDDVGLWGVETAHAPVLLCGAGARRGGGVSGIPGRAAAMAVLGR
jgi:phytoene dehydrogenase-like protein